MRRSHGALCRCAECRHKRFNPGPATNARCVNFYGHFTRKLGRHRHELVATAEHIREGGKAHDMPKWMRRVLRALLGGA